MYRKGDCKAGENSTADQTHMAMPLEVLFIAKDWLILETTRGLRIQKFWCQSAMMVMHKSALQLLLKVAHLSD